MVVVNPYRLCVGEVVFDFKDLLCNLLVYLYIVFPVLKIVITHVSDILEVMKEWS